MTRHPAALALFATLALAACGAPAPDADDPITPDAPSATPLPSAAPEATATPLAGQWDMNSSDEGDGLFFAVSADGSARAHLFCPNGGDANQRFLVNIRAFEPVGSEERMTVGSGDTVVTLVAEPGGDPVRGGVSGKGPVPADLRAILTGGEGMAVNYGNQNLGPLPAVPADMADAFVSGCGD